MSIEIVNLFTSGSNINYVRNELTKKINDSKIREAVLDTLTESLFDFQSYAMIEDSGQNLRHSTNNKLELDRLNKSFINDRLSFANNFDMYSEGKEFYADQMFIDDSLRPGPYGSFNDPHKKENNSSHYSHVPANQINKRGPTDYGNVDELRESEVSHIRKIETYKKPIDHLSTLPLDIRPKWIDI